MSISSIPTAYGTVGVLFGQGNGSFYDPVEYPVGGYAWGLLSQM